MVDLSAVLCAADRGNAVSANIGRIEKAVKKIGIIQEIPGTAQVDSSGEHYFGGLV